MVNIKYNYELFYDDPKNGTEKHKKFTKYADMIAYISKGKITDFKVQTTELIEDIYEVETNA